MKTLGLSRFALYLHDFGSPIGARLAIMAPERIAAQIIQNGDIPYEDALGPKYAEIEETWTLPEPEMRAQLAKAINEETFKEEFLNALDDERADRIPPDLWKLHWSLVTPKRKEVAIDLIAGLKQNRAWFPAHRQYLATHEPPTLIVWGRTITTCPRNRRAPICATCHRPSCICSMAAIGCSRRTSTRCRA